MDKLPDAVSDTLLDAIEKLVDNPRPQQGCKKLQGRNGFRIRKGDYRIIHDIFDDILVVHIVAAGHRRDIYTA